MTDETQVPSDRAIDFGYRDIPEREKGHRVREVFDRVASRYDLMNDLMSLGVHRVWKSIAITELSPRASDTLLDVAGGTGDLARAFTRRGGGLAIVCDINGEMLEAGRKRGGRGLLWTRGDAEHLPFPDRSMTAYTIAFGIRNVTHRDQALAEAVRVLRPGGRFLCLEFSMPDVPGLEEIYDWYSFKVIPRIGRAVTGSSDPYQYLVESIRRFPAPETFLDMMSAAGLKRCKAVRLSGGVATMYTGWRI